MKWRMPCDAGGVAVQDGVDEHREPAAVGGDLVRQYTSVENTGRIITAGARVIF